MTGQIQPTNPMVRGVPPRPPMPMAQGMGMTPKEIIGILRRHILLIVFLTFGGLMFGGVSWFLMARYFPKYTAMTGIKVLPPGVNDPMMFGGVQPNKDLYYQFRNTKAAIMKQQNVFQELLKRDKIRETRWFKQFGDNMAKAIPDAVEKLEKKMGISAQREGDWIRVSMTCGSKKESALIVNEMVNMFLTMQRESATRDIRAQLAERVSRQKAIKSTLLQQEENLEAVRKGTKYTNLEPARFRDYLAEKIKDLEIKINDFQSQVGFLESNIKTLERRAQGEFDDVVREQMERDNIANNLRLRITGIEAQLASLLTRFGEDHRLVRQTRESLRQSNEDLGKRQNQIAELQRKSSLRLANDNMTALLQTMETLHEQRLLAEREYKQFDNIRADYAKILVKRDEQQEILEEITVYINKQKIQLNDPTISKLLSMEPAPEPLRMSSPNIKVYVPGGFVLGFMLAVGLAFAIELLNDLLRTPSDVMKHLRVPLLGMICHVEDDDEIDGIDLYHVVQQAPYSMMSECYRLFRTNLKLSGSGEGKKTILVTSGNAGEGKTSVAINMTATLIAEGHRVLYVDTNFRKPVGPTLCPKRETKDTIEHVDFGLSNYLMGQCDIGRVIRAGNIEGLDVIDSGPLPLNPSNLLASNKMGDLLEDTAQMYDYVIIDGPPLLVSEAKILASQADGTILVFNATSTRRGAAQRALRELKSTNAHIIGTVLLGVRSMKGGYFHEVYRSYQEYQRVPVSQPV